MSSLSPFQEARARAWREQLRASGYRLTRPRRAVIDITASTERALNPAEVHARAQERCPGLGLVTVYRTLETLESLGLVQRVHRQDGCHGYVAGFEGHQHLLICRECDRVTVFDGDDLQRLIARVEGESGYEIREHWLQLFGSCDHCLEGSSG